MHAPILLASLFRLPVTTTTTAAPKHAQSRKTHTASTFQEQTHGDGGHHEIPVLTWWAELLLGDDVFVFQPDLDLDLDIYCDDCEDCEDPLVDDVEAEEGVAGEGVQRSSGLSWPESTDGVRREREADVWRTRLGG